MGYCALAADVGPGPAVPAAAVGASGRLPWLCRCAVPAAKRGFPGAVDRLEGAVNRLLLEISRKCRGIKLQPAIGPARLRYAYNRFYEIIKCAIWAPISTNKLETVTGAVLWSKRWQSPALHFQHIGSTPLKAANLQNMSAKQASLSQSKVPEGDRVLPRERPLPRHACHSRGDVLDCHACSAAPYARC